MLIKQILYSLLTAQILFAVDAKVYPLSAIYMSDDASKNTAFVKSLGSSEEDRSLTKGRMEFLQQMKANFQESTVDSINKMNVNKTFISYFKVPRVSLYKLDKPDTTADYYLPVTGALTMANMKTGEILYSLATTNYSVYRGLGNGIDDDAKKTNYAEGMTLTINELVKKAKESFRPFNVTTSVSAIWNDYLILDKGLEHGVNHGDLLENQHGAEIKIIHTESDYSIARISLGKVQKGDTFNKMANGSLASLKKEKIGLIENDVSYPYFTWDTMKQFFTDKVGENAAFSLLPLDKTFYSAQQQAFAESQSGLSQELGTKRPLPSMYVKVNLGNPYYWRTPSDKEFAFFDNYAINTCALMSNANGVITYSTCSSEQQKDMVIGNSRFSNEATYEKITKNALLSIAENFSKNIKPSSKKATVQKVENTTANLHPDSPFVKNESVTVFRKIDSKINVPIAEGKISAEDKTRLNVFFNAKIQTGDEIVSRSLGNSVQETLLAFGETETLPGIQLPEFDTMSKFIVAENSKYNCLVWDDVKNSMINTFSNQFGFEKNLQVNPPQTPLYLIPRYQVEQLEESCSSDDGICKGKYIIFAGVKVLNTAIDTNKPVFKAGYEVEITLQFPKENTAKRDFELTNEALKLLKNAAKEVQL